MEESKGFTGWAVVEEWRPVVGFEGLYEVSDRGRVRRVGRAARNGKGRGGGAQIGLVLRLQEDRHGRRHVQLWRNGSYYNRLVHCLVASAFLGPCPQGKEVNHKRGVQAGDAAENLEYLTRSENILHAYATGLRAPGFAGRPQWAT